MVLIAVINRLKDLEILLGQKLYRIRANKVPKRRFTHIAFYQTCAFGKNGKRVEYFGKTSKRYASTRRRLLPDEQDHPRAGRKYKVFIFKTVNKLPRPIKNTSSMRMLFGLVSLERFLKFKTLHNLFGVRPLEAALRRLLRKAGIKFYPEYRVRLKDGRRYRLDVAIFCRDGKIDIECDNRKYHGGQRRVYDRRRDRHLRAAGWKIIRFSERQILRYRNRCLERTLTAIRALGGVSELRM